MTEFGFKKWGIVKTVFGRLISLVKSKTNTSAKYRFCVDSRKIRIMFEEHKVRIISGLVVGKFEACEGLELLAFLIERELGELVLLFELEECGFWGRNFS